MLTTLERAVAWAQSKSMWPDTFGLACCAIEMMSIVSSRYDIARFGMEAFRASPRQADLLIVSGRVVHKMAEPLRQIYDQMLEPKWVIAMGACASSGGMFNNYTTLQGVDKIVPVDIHVPGLPAAAGGAHGGHRAGCTRRSWPACRPRTRSAGSPSDVRGRSRARRDEGGARRDDARRRSSAPRRGVPPPARQARLQLPLRPLVRRLRSAGARSPSPATGETPWDATSTRPARPRCRGRPSRSRSASPSTTTCSASPRARVVRGAYACRSGSTTARP